MNNGLDTLFTRIWVQSITNVADDGVQLAKEMITDPSQVKDMVDISNSFNDLFQKTDGAQVAEAIFRDFFSTVGGLVAGGIAGVSSIPWAGPWAPAVGLAGGEAFSRAWQAAFDEAKNWSSNNNIGGKIYDWMNPTSVAKNIDPKCGRDFNNAQRPPRKDPLTLDLDNDGLETVAVSSSLLFDHDGDGIKNASGWIGADDGFLVLDRNGNGTIDNGTELFGDSTPDNNGKTTFNPSGKMADGFAALKQEDTNTDGKVDSQDARWSQLRVWRDLNQDGVSQATELFSLGQLGITSFSTTKIANRETLANGNEIADLGTYTKADGSAGTMGEIARMGDINLVEDTFHREFPGQIPLAEGVVELPEMGGSGKVRDLREAASQSERLKALLSEFSEAATRQEQRAQFAELLDAWADTSGLIESLNARMKSIYGTTAGATYEAFGNDKISNYYVTDGYGNYVISGYYSNGIPQYIIKPEWYALVAEWEQKIHILEAFNGRYFFNLGGSDEAGSGGAGASTSGGGGGGILAGPQISVSFTQEQIDFLNSAYNALQESVYSALVLQTRMTPLFDQIQLVVDGEGIRLDYSQLVQTFESRIAQHSVNGMADLMEFNQYVGRKSLVGTGWNGDRLMEQSIRALTITPELESLYKEFNVLLVGREGAVGSGTPKDDIIIGAGGGKIEGNGGDDAVFAGAGGDSVYGGDGNDVLYGGSSGDLLYGQAGNDTLDGGAGNDLMQGDAGSDAYLFGAGDGQDLIYNADVGDDRSDVLIFKEGVKASDVAVRRISENGYQSLELSVAGTTDKVTVRHFFANNNPGANGLQLDRIEFADGTAWTPSDIVAALFAGTSDNDAIVGTINHDTISGGEGDDKLYGDNGSDALNGGNGVDKLYGESGNDTLEGGTGNDSLEGGTGNDVYLFGRGDGEDLIYNCDEGAGRLDVLRFKEGVAPADVTVRRVGENGYQSLELSVVGTTDKVTIRHFFAGENPGANTFQIDRIEFGDGTVWGPSDIVAMLFAGASGDLSVVGTIRDDTIYGGGGNNKLFGGQGNDVLHGGDGVDMLYGEGGNDTLDGGAGNDHLEGGTGNDVYLFGRGDGQDLIYNYDGGVGRLDVLRFKESVSPSEMVVRRVFENGYDSLELSIAGTHDKVTVRHFFAGNNPGANGYQIDRIEFADGTVWTPLQIVTSNLFSGTPGNDSIAGTINADFISAAAGDDTLSGGAGNDTLDGGAGNDRLEGDTGNNTYLFGIGDGQDVIRYYNDTAPGKLNTLQFKEGVLPQEVMLKQVSGPWGAGVDLEVAIAGTLDKITIQNFFVSNNPGNGYNPVQQFTFADGTTWNISAIVAKLFSGTGGADDITGTMAADTLQGLAGSDYLKGGDGHDFLNGGDGTDTLSGGAGNDTLDGGAGNDRLEGDTGNNMYLFGIGDGQDVIRYYNDTTTGKLNTLQFREGILPQEIMLKQVSGLWGPATDLEVSVAGITDKITIQGFFIGADPGNSYNPVQQFTFADGTTWNISAIVAKLFSGTGGADDLTGTIAADTIYGGDGNDTLSGGSGDDVLIGGPGSDSLTGGAGSDIFKLVSTDQGVDSLADFTSGTDAIHVVSSSFGMLTGDAVTLVAGTTTPAASGTAPQFLYNSSSGALYFDRDGASSVYSAVPIVTLTGQKTLVAADIVVVE